MLVEAYIVLASGLKVKDAAAGMIVSTAFQLCPPSVLLKIAGGIPSHAFFSGRRVHRLGICWIDPQSRETDTLGELREPDPGPGYPAIGALGKAGAAGAGVAPGV
jgi:hypothetical protein